MSVPIQKKEAGSSVDSSESKEDNWRKSRPSWGSKISFLFQAGMFQDLKISVSNGKTRKTFFANQMVLIVSSEVFEEMLLYKKSATLKDIQEIIIRDTNPEIFGSFLRFIYCKDLDVYSMPQVLEVMRISKRFLIYDCEERCISYIKDHVDHINVFIVYDYAKTHDLDFVQKMCEEKIQKQIREILVEDNFKKLDVDAILAVLDQRILNMRELELYLTVMKWLDSNAQTQGEEFKKRTLKLILKHFCYLGMLPEEFTQGPGSKGYLTESQFNGIMSAILRDGKHPFPQDFKFCAREVFGELSLITASRRSQISHEYMIREVTNGAIFVTVDTAVDLIGIRIMSRIGKDDERYVERAIIRVMNCEHNESFHWKIIQCAKFEESVNCSKTYVVHFGEKIRLEKDKRYSLILEVHDPYAYPTINLLDATVSTNNITFKFTKYLKLSPTLPISSILYEELK